MTSASSLSTAMSARGSDSDNQWAQLRLHVWKADARDGLLLADSVSSRARQEADFRCVGLAGQGQLSAKPGNSHCRPWAAGQSLTANVGFRLTAAGRPPPSNVSCCPELPLAASVNRSQLHFGSRRSIECPLAKAANWRSRPIDVTHRTRFGASKLKFVLL